MRSKLPVGIHVIVADAKKALLLVSEKGDDGVSLTVREAIEAAANPRTSEQGSDRPGRAISGTRRSRVGQTDWHKQAEDAFARQVVDRLIGSSPDAQLILVAPPTFLHEIRKHLGTNARRRVIRELAKDLMHLPLQEIEKHLAE